MKYSNLVFISLLFLFASCGTLGGFDNVDFLANRKKVSEAIDSLYKSNPQYKVPDKWQKFDDWEQRGFGFLKGKVFYFQFPPEEMYYVSFVEDTTQASSIYQSTMAIRAVHFGTGRWNLESDVSSAEKKRIETRFRKEIVSKIEILIR